jgi:acyl-CoA synthetase (NDP forming)
MKVGRSARGAAAAASHTGALAGADPVFDGVLRRYGVHRAHNVEQLLDLGLVLSRGRPARGTKITIVTLSGGAGVLMTDYAEDLGLEVFSWDQLWRDKVATSLPPFASLANPIDVTGEIVANQQMLSDALTICVENPDTDILMVLLGNLEAEQESVCQRIIDVAAVTDKPVIVTWIGGSGYAQTVLSAEGIPTFGEPLRAMRAAAALPPRLTSPMVTTPTEPPRLHDARAILLRAAGAVRLDEVESKQVIGHLGVPCVQELDVDDVRGAVAAAEQIGYPVAVKLLTPAIAHKSEIGGVAAGLTDLKGVETAAEGILESARRHGVPDARLVVQHSVTPGPEVIVGMSHDPTFGPVVVVGIGGILTETLADVQVLPAPVTPSEAQRMIESLRGVQLLRGVRAWPAVDEGALAKIVADFSVGAAAIADLVESIDVNPLMLDSSGRLVAIDAVVELRKDGA